MWLSEHVLLSRIKKNISTCLRLGLSQDNYLNLWHCEYQAMLFTMSFLSINISHISCKDYSKANWTTDSQLLITKKKKKKKKNTPMVKTNHENTTSSAELCELNIGITLDRIPQYKRLVFPSLPRNG